jgi:hypothetical protein
VEPSPVRCTPQTSVSLWRTRGVSLLFSVTLTNDNGNCCGQNPDRLKIVSFPVISADVDPPAGAWPAVLTGNDLFLLSERADTLQGGDVDLATNRPMQGREVARASWLRSLEQRVLFCRCGSTSIYVRGFCQRCYHRERADRKHFAGLREQVLARDGHRCRGCQAGAVDSVLSVHHREPGRSSLGLLVTLCPACHALIERTQVLFRDVPELLRVLWRERHPAASEQMLLFAL